LTLEYAIRRATLGDLRIAAELFDAYRQFYGQPPDNAIATTFLLERLTLNDSVVYLALGEPQGKGLGFVQLYPSFSSVAARRIWILNDLFVAPEARRHGVGRALLDEARDHAAATGAKRLVLSTGVANRAAQALYEQYGYVQDSEFSTYKFEL
jgi:GNAT superfamily N-acetyltransferase